MMTSRVSQKMLKLFRRSYSATKLETKLDFKHQPAFAMNKPGLYGSSNSIQMKTNLAQFKKYEHKIKWNKNGDTAIDLGCGDGGFSLTIKNAAPCNFQKYVCSDKNGVMVQYASERYAGENISFRVLDIEKEVPVDLISSFNHVFSFYAIHWIKHQEKAFQNIYKLLTNEGDCFLTIIATTAIYDVYNVLSQHPKWKSWLHNVDMFISPYHCMEKPERKVSEIMKKSGFKNVEVECNQVTSVQQSLQELKDIVQAVEPFNMPDEIFADFYEYYKKTGQEIGVLHIDSNSNGEVTSVKYDYNVLTCYGSK